ncbi:hypothetical protein ElyMa_002730500 [Elysia marginata]|uniref:Uncharacterized protein n=1 Tax=Elysia marginata TaxID=1093978 RepID=A0AAV4HIC8_9GAST|nr:hypothetical protein ElyMa_002730500 [Elysia marginata]
MEEAFGVYVRTRRKLWKMKEHGKRGEKDDEGGGRIAAEEEGDDEDRGGCKAFCRFTDSPVHCSVLSRTSGNDMFIMLLAIMDSPVHCSLLFRISGNDMFIMLHAIFETFVLRG